MVDYLTSQLERLPQVWIPFVICLGLVSICVWRIANKIFEERFKAHEAREAVSDRQLRFLQDQLSDTVRDINDIRQVATDNVGQTLYRRTVLVKSNEQRREEKIFVSNSVTPQMLISSMKGRTNTEAIRLIKPYLGQWIRVEGKIADVIAVDYQGQRTIYVRSDSMGEPIIPELMTSDIVAMFSDDMPEMDTARIGDRIAVSGKIDRVFIGSLLLTQCEVVSD